MLLMNTILNTKDNIMEAAIQETTPAVEQDIPSEVLPAPLPPWITPVDKLPESSTKGTLEGMVFRKPDSSLLMIGAGIVVHFKEGAMDEYEGIARTLNTYSDEYKYMRTREYPLVGVHTKSHKHNIISRWAGVYKVTPTPAQWDRLKALETEDEVRKEMFEIRTRKVRNELKDVSATPMHAMIPTITRRIELRNKEDRRMAENLLRERAEQYEQARRAFIKAETAYNKGTEHITESLNAILNDTWYEYLESPDEWTHLFATPEITLTHGNMRVNMGRFTVRLTIDDGFNVEVHKYQHNRTYEEYYHPHVNSSGEICWGNARVAQEKASLSYDAVKLMGLLRTVLTVYNDESPYRGLYRYVNIPQEGVTPAINVHNYMHKLSGRVVLYVEGTDLEGEGVSIYNAGLEEGMYRGLDNGEHIHSDELEVFDVYEQNTSLNEAAAVGRQTFIIVNGSYVSFQNYEEYVYDEEYYDED